MVEAVKSRTKKQKTAAATVENADENEPSATSTNAAA